MNSKEGGGLTVRLVSVAAIARRQLQRRTGITYAATKEPAAMPMSAALSAARHASTTRAAHMTGGVSSTTSTTTAMPSTTAMHFSKSGRRKSQCQSRDVKNCSHDWFTFIR